MSARIIYPDDDKDWLKITSAKIVSLKNHHLSKVASSNVPKIKSIIVVSVIGIFAIVTLLGFHLTEIIAEEIQQPEYLSAEGVTTTGIFKFREGDEIVPIQVFSQTSGFQRSKPFQFTFQKVVGDTPILHSITDEAYLYRNSELQKQNNNRFDVEILLNTGPDVKRAFSYSKCFVDDYSVTTLRDNEEGYFNKGFAVVENYSIECKDMVMHNPALDEQNNDIKKPDTTSSMDLKEPFPTWSDNFKYQKSDSQQ